MQVADTVGVALNTLNASFSQVAKKKEDQHPRGRAGYI